MDVKKRVNEIFEKYGVGMDEETTEMDSLTFVSMVIEIESEFGIELPEDLLNYISFNKARIVNYLLSIDVDDEKN